jgi:membrane protein implicated in regulation of membrane protease activity
MKSNTILLIGSIIVVIAAGLWYFEKIAEPTFSIISALLTALAYFLARKEEHKKNDGNQSGTRNVFNNNTTIGTQINNPTGNINLNSPKDE